MSAIAVSASVLIGLLYTAFSSSSTNDPRQSEQASSDVTTSAKGLPDIVPVASAALRPMDTLPTQPEGAISPSIPTTPARPGPAPKNTSVPASTVKTKKGKWIRD